MFACSLMKFANMARGSLDSTWSNCVAPETLPEATKVAAHSGTVTSLMRPWCELGVSRRVLFSDPSLREAQFKLCVYHL
jgi:hypothetical protein